MSDDDRFDAMLKQMAAEEYNRPPQIVPREAMWDAVRAELAKPAAPVAAGGSAGATGAAAHRVGSSVWRFAALALAAMLLLAVGIGIGRQWGANGTAPSASIAGNDRTPPAARDSSDPATPGASIPGGTVPGSSRPDDGRMLASSSDPVRPSGPDRSATDQPRPRPTGPDRAAPNDLAGAESPTAYSVAAVYHLSEVEALLTAFKSDLGERRMDAQISSWARELLSSTRLLLDSPAGQDVARRKLLQDLELVLVQIVQLSPGTSDADRDMIKGALTDDQVLMRLRTAIPAGQRGA